MTAGCSRIENVFTRAWYGDAGWVWLLWPLSKLFQLGSCLRRFYYRRWPPEMLPLPVVIVGGITVGGTGKTPVTIALVKALAARGLRVGVVSRGYGGAVGRNPLLVHTSSMATFTGDEPLLISLLTKVPVVVGGDRSAAVRLLHDEYDLDIVLSDDGLQHYAMPRIFEIAVLDAQRGLGNGYLLPMGPLRECERRLDDVDWILERNGERVDTSFSYSLNDFRHWRTQVVVHPSEVLKQWANARVVAVTALGQPEQFFQSLERLGLDISRYAFPDHYTLSKSDLDVICGDIVVITEKDAVKIKPFDDDRIWVLSISTQIPARLIDTLLEKICKQSGTAECTIS